MDDIDIIICKALIREARMPYRDLAKLTGLSSVAVHKRVQELARSGVINGFKAEIDIRALRGASIMVFGRSDIPSASELSDVLSKDERTSMVLVGSGNYVYVGGILRSITDLESFVEFVRTSGKMPQAIAGLHTTRPSGVKVTDIQDPSEITPLEMRIIASLRNDARKRTTDVAKELGVSARLVGSKLQKMIREFKINLTIRWRPDYCSDTVALVHITLKEGENKSEAINLLREKYSRNMVFFSAFGNLPELLLATMWARSSKEISEVADSLMKEKQFKTFTPNIICAGYFFDTWKEKILDGVKLKA